MTAGVARYLIAQRGGFVASPSHVVARPDLAPDLPKAGREAPRYVRLSGHCAEPGAVHALESPPG